MPSKNERLCAEENFTHAIETLWKTLPKDFTKDRKALLQVRGEEDKLRPENVGDFIGSLIQAREATSKVRARKAKDVATLWFRASLPFTQLFLAVLQDSASLVTMVPASLLTS